MSTALLAFSPQDGDAAATRLADLLAAIGIDARLEDDRTARAQPDTVIALLTPAALGDPQVIALLGAASTRRTTLVPLPIADPARFPTASDLAVLIERLNALAAPSTGGAEYQVGVAINTAVGDNSTVVNAGGAGSLSGAEATQLVTALRAWQPDHALDGVELRSLFASVEARIQQVGMSVRRLHVDMLARFDLNEQRILAPILARLNEQHAEEVALIIDVFDATAITADELDHHLAVIDAALADVLEQSVRIADRELVASAAQMAEIISAPGFDVAHKLKLSVPIVPLLLSYEGEVSIGSGMDLEAAWQALRRWASRRNG